MKRILILFIISTFTTIIYGQDVNFYNKDTTILDFDYFTLKDTIKIEIIKNYPIKAGCGSMAFAAMTIGKIINNNQYKFDTITVISLCDEEQYNEKEIVKIIPDKKPPYSVNYGMQDITINGYTNWRIIGFEYPITFGFIVREKK